MLSLSIVLTFFFYGNILIAQNFVVKPYLQDGYPNQMTIMWETDNNGNGFVDWGTSPFSLTNTVSSTSILGNGNTRIHTAVIVGLSPNKKYYYKARTNSGTISKLYHFKTHPNISSNQSINFVAVSDMQRDVSNPGVFRDLIENGIIPVVDTALINGVEGIEGIIIPGDLVQTGGTYASWKNDFFDLADSIAPYTPIYPVPGNHEYYGGGLPNFLKYFTLPLNGSAGNLEEWWYKDISNVRLIGLNSNSPSADLATQLTWIQGVLDNAGDDPNIDFVFAQLHHPYKSELWIPGELDFTGDIISLLENFSSSYNKPSIHFFGHTHAYSRGASRDHQHFWVNVATAGGAIDNWGEFPNADYDEFVISEDEYGFVLIQVEAGLDPSFRLRRFSRGDENLTEDNTLSDDLTIKKYGYGPNTPKGIYPVTDSIFTNCVILKASKFSYPGSDHQASHWQISETCDFTGSNVVQHWKQSSNWYNEVNSQAGDDLTDETIPGLMPNRSYCWRVRYRDQTFKWSEWSNPLTFHTKSPTTNITSNLLINNDAENGISDWTGDIESLLNNECNSVPVYQGTRFFAVGGVCANEQNVGIASQLTDVSTFGSAIDAGLYLVEYKAFMRAFANNNDMPELYLEFLNTSLGTISTSAVISSATPVWIEKSSTITIPPGTRSIRTIMKGTRLSGTDNDSYFDELSLRLIQNNCPSCFGSNQSTSMDSDGDDICDNIDCAPNNPSSFQGNIELCDGLDNDCDGIADSGNTVLWTGIGDGISWSDPANWNQNMLPLPCQHVIITSGNVQLKGRSYIKSMNLQSGATLTITSGSELTIDGFDTITMSSVVIAGNCYNHGRFYIRHSDEDGLKVSGSLENKTGGLVAIDNTYLHGIIITSTGIMINNSEVQIKE